MKHHITLEEVEVIVKEFSNKKSIKTNKGKILKSKAEVYKDILAFCKANNYPAIPETIFWRVLNSVYSDIQTFRKMVGHKRKSYTNISYGDFVEEERPFRDWGKEKTWFNIVVTKEIKEKMNLVKNDGINWQEIIRDHIERVIETVGK